MLQSKLSTSAVSQQLNRNCYVYIRGGTRSGLIQTKSSTESSKDDTTNKILPMDI